MSSSPHQAPKYRHYKPKDLAVVRIDGRDHYLGKFGTPESKERYHRLLAERSGAGAVVAPPSPQAGQDAISVGEVILVYWKHVEQHYRAPDGTPGHEIVNIQCALRPLRRLYGTTPAVDFGPKALKLVRAEMVRSGLARTTVNGRVNRIRRAFKWAASEELIPESIASALTSVAGLEKGRSAARESKGVAPVPVEHVEAVLPHLMPAVAALVRLQLLTGMRPGEACQMRGCDLTPGEPTWEYRPSGHKNAWRGIERVIPLGPRAVAIVKASMKTDLQAYLFAPAETVAAHHARRKAGRKSKPTPSEVAKRAEGGPGARHGQRYSRRAYLQSIHRACRKGGVPEWTPNQLRHTAASLIRARFGLEAAQNVLGHARPDTTLIYAERDITRAREVMAQVG